MTKLAIIHTTPATIEPLKALAAEMLPDCEIVNFVDDSILPQLAHNGGDVTAIVGRIGQYAQFAQEVGANVILEACSSVGAVVDEIRPNLNIPIIRIDDAMAEQAVRQGNHIGVAATLQTTLNPTLALLQQKADASGKSVTFEPCLVSSAYQKLLAGDKDGHDSDLVVALTELANSADVVVLAQASMARVLPRLPEAQRDRFLTSPRLGMAQVRQAVEAQG